MRDSTLGASLQRQAKNSKLSKITYVQGSGRYLRPVAHEPFVASTYVSIHATCPASCIFKGAGCYAQSGITGSVMRRLDTNARKHKYTHHDVIEQEARLIESIQDPKGRPLRLHVGGDCRTKAGAWRLAKAARVYMDRGGGPVWTYTHAWREVHRVAWGSISVLASVETAEQAREARDRGYAPALVVPEFKEKTFAIDRTLYIACPAEVRESNCAECRLCMDDHKLKGRYPKGIAFKSHGQRKTTVNLNLTQPRFPGVK